jgi:hypothetical protein
VDAPLFLASDCSSWIASVTLDVAGGRVMGREKCLKEHDAINIVPSTSREDGE